MANAQLNATWRLNNQPFIRSLQEALSRIKKTAQEFKSAFAKNPFETTLVAGIKIFSKAAEGAKQALHGISSGIGVGFGFGIERTFERAAEAVADFVKESIKLAASAQDAKAAFETLTGSSDQADKKLAEILKFSNANGLRFEKVKEGARALEILTNGALDNAKGLKLVGDVADGTQQDFAEMANTIGKAYAALRSGGNASEELAALQGRKAITPDQARQVKLTASVEGQGHEAWEQLVKALGRFDGQMDRTANNFSRRTERMKDNIEQLQRSFGEGIVDSLGEWEDTVNDVLEKDEVRGEAKDLGNKAGGVISPKAGEKVAKKTHNMVLTGIAQALNFVADLTVPKDDMGMSIDRSGERKAMDLNRRGLPLLSGDRATALYSRIPTVQGNGSYMSRVLSGMRSGPDKFNNFIESAHALRQNSPVFKQPDWLKAKLNESASSLSSTGIPSNFDQSFSESVKTTPFHTMLDEPATRTVSSFLPIGTRRNIDNATRAHIDAQFIGNAAGRAKAYRDAGLDPSVHRSGDFKRMREVQRQNELKAKGGRSELDVLRSIEAKFDKLQNGG